MQHGLRTRKHGFTLVEILVVIVIIAILGAIATPAILRALDSAKAGATVVEINLLSNAVEAYRTEYGSYPPDFSDKFAVINHLNRIFPRRQEILNVEQLDEYLVASGFSPGGAYAVHAHALVFWLRGFYPNPEYPITGNGIGDRQPLIEINVNMIQGDGNLETLDDVFVSAQHGSGINPPFVYFDSRSCDNVQQSYWGEYGSGTCAPKTFLWNGPDGQLVAVPYLGTILSNPNDPNSIEFVNEKSFQIIAAGQDKLYGFITESSNQEDTSYANINALRNALQTNVRNEAKIFPNGGNYALSDRDNLTNFSTKRLGDAVE